MNCRRVAHGSITVALFFCALMACRPAAAYWDDRPALAWNIAVPSSADSFPVYQLGTIGYLTIGAPPVAAPPPQVEIITTDRTGHPVNGIPGIYQPKYDEGHKVGYDTGYESGFLSGKQRGTEEGTANGRSDGYNKGYGETYQPAFDAAYNTLLPVGEKAGWNQGQINGFAEGYNWAPILAGSVSVSNHNYGSGTFGSLSISSIMYGDLGLHSYVSLSPDEVPAFYYKLGLDDGTAKGTSDGSADGYKVTYADAYAAAYPIGYQNGTVEGVAQGTANGESQGFAAGWDLGYGPGFDIGFYAGIQHYLSGQQPSSSFGTLSIEIGGDIQVGDFGATIDSSNVVSDESVPEPATLPLLSVAIGAVIFRRAGRK